MKVLVTAKQVATVDDDDFEVGVDGVDEQFLEYDLNEWDEYAVESGVSFAEECDDDVEVVSVTIGPEQTEETIRMVLAKGVDRAIRVWDDALDEDALRDVETKAALLEAVAERESPDLVLTGVQASDDGLGATGVALAATMDVAWAAVANDVEIDADAETVHARRELEGGLEEVTDVALPAVLTIQTGINEPRYASLRGIRQAQRKEILPLGLDDLDVDATQLKRRLSVKSTRVPETTSTATLFEGEADETATDLAEMLRDEGVTAE
ncbi:MULTISPECIES: electron transfer flavoprotein subunit beta/FixA family protein [Haloferax]|uniref:Electron transfer flavoprotein subunit beta/FixA family protein n=1 Tax=Haloferax marinum TaxID=2666143 RepID=A0A6A8G762_9EURY|nr:MULTISPECIES: electron transfer flavoprotein subunit beta/FixA family protein [Haloferax]KAB1197822.1 electron transfer flavoprotein subunit beta/FixA family protein [Haloferax sp. CBA1150]MRW96881.1 electron transfer flavoprotein subunit beta/FixA family protein [Haloferax marinum]